MNLPDRYALAGLEHYEPIPFLAPPVVAGGDRATVTLHETMGGIVARSERPLGIGKHRLSGA